MFEVKIAKVLTKKTRKRLWTVVLVMTTGSGSVKMMRYQGRFLTRRKALRRASKIRSELIKEFGKENVK